MTPGSSLAPRSSPTSDDSGAASFRPFLVVSRLHRGDPALRWRRRPTSLLLAVLALGGPVATALVFVRDLPVTRSRTCPRPGRGVHAPARPEAGTDSYLSEPLRAELGVSEQRADGARGATFPGRSVWHGGAWVAGRTIRRRTGTLEMAFGKGFTNEWVRWESNPLPRCYEPTKSSASQSQTSL